MKSRLKQNWNAFWENNRRNDSFRLSLVVSMMVDADSYRNAPLFGDIDDRLDAFDAAYIARVDPDCIRAVLHGCNRETVIKMNVRHDRDVDLFLYLGECFRRLHGRDSAADDLAAGIFELSDLGDSRLKILCLRVGHRLDSDRVSSSDDSVSDSNFFCMISVHGTHLSF